MVFTTQTFLFVFFPLCLLTYFIIYRLEQCKYIGKFLLRTRGTDLILIVFSMGFYMWSCFDDLIRLLVYIIIIYLMARWIESSKYKHKYITIESNISGNFSRKPLYLDLFPFYISIITTLFFLIYYNYTGILSEIWNWAFKDHVEIKSIISPLGLSFITFSAISYLSDIYHDKATAGSLIDCALYLTFFPKIVSGPIVLWKDFQVQISTRKCSLTLTTEGINRIIIGFSKKIILADSFGSCIAQIGTYGFDQLTAAGTLLLYMLQIYYDFSGYSDIAIGLSKLFGFEVKENFNFPYRSTSISEFWRRWHISLGTWFREYVYFPLGGSRAGYCKTLRNLAIVFTLTGIWHGAGWNYILWGFINGTFVVLERIIQSKSIYQKIPKLIKYFSTMLIVMLFWQLFRFQTISDIVNLFKIILGISHFDTVFYTWEYFFDTRMLLFILIGIIGSTLLGDSRVIYLYKKGISKNAGFMLQETVLLVLFIISILFMVNSTYSPFIYFQY